MTYIGRGTTTGEAVAWDGSNWSAAGRAVITDWVAYTPTFSAQGGGASVGDGTIEGFWRRIGDSMQVAVRLNWGSTTTAGSGVSRWSIPSGFTIDESKMPSLNTGYLWISESGVASNRQNGTCILHPSDTGAEIGSIARANTETSPTAPITWGSGDHHEVDVTFPVVEWAVP